MRLNNGGFGWLIAVCFASYGAAQGSDSIVSSPRAVEASRFGRQAGGAGPVVPAAARLQLAFLSPQESQNGRSHGPVAAIQDGTCTFAFSPTSATYGEQGVTNASTNLITQAGCPWGVTISDPWISVSRTTLFMGPTTLVYSVAPNPGGGTRTGTITAGGAVFTITQTSSAPSLVDTTNGTTGTFETFSYTVSDPDGAGDLNVTDLLINNALDGRQACYLAVDHANGVLYLVNDAGNNLLPGLVFDTTGHTSGVISNSQCSVDGSQSSLVNLGANQVAVQLAVTFTTAFGGNKVLYFAARDKELNNTGWLPLGTWNVPANLTYPNVVSVSASSVAAGTPTTITATYQDATDNANLTPSQILINSAVDGRSACYVGYDHKNNILYLVDDQGANLLAGITPGVGTATQQNSQCTIYAQTSAVQASGRNYTLTIGVSFQNAFKGLKIVYAATQTIAGANTGWQAMTAIAIQ